MKKIYVQLFLLMAVLLCSCAKDDINGDLDGLWQLRTITYAAHDSTVQVQDSLRFMAVQLHLLELRNNQKNGRFARFHHSGDSLTIEMIDSTVITKSWMLSFGMDDVRQHFYVETLNRKHLVLRSSFAHLVFHKF